MIPKLLLFLTTTFIYGDLYDHLKKVEKQVCHSIRNVDFIYMINLDQRPEKWKQSIQQLIPYGITPCRFSAVNGWELSLEAINDVGLKFSPEMEGGIWGTSYLDESFEPRHGIIQNLGQTYFCHCMARGTIGIALSHISILQDAFDSGYETIWVMEDDIEIQENPHLLSDLIDQLDDLVGRGNWDVLFTDRDIRDRQGAHIVSYHAAPRPDFLFYRQFNNFAEKTVCGNHFCKIGSRYGAHSMILRRSGIIKLLTFFKAHQIFLPYDMDYILAPGINLYSLMIDVVTNLTHALSDNGAPYYLDKQEDL